MSFRGMNLSQTHFRASIGFFGLLTVLLVSILLGG